MNRIFISVLILLSIAATTVHADEAGGSDTPLTVPGEVIKIEGRLPPKVKPRPRNYSQKKAPPYSDRALLSDAWTKAWLLLDVSADGEVIRFKFLKRPGYDLETIAASEVFKLRFEPARDHSDKPVRTLLLWSIEWPSAGWLEKLVGTRSRMPPLIGIPPNVRSQSDYVPCAGSGPWHMDSVHKTYKDCSKPDWSNEANEPWITPSVSAHRGEINGSTR
ncbi:MAG TPA: hypothetical protein VIU61_17585 [Kofleriaceae bacterium]